MSDFYDSKRLSWMVDFSPDSLINMRFRKEELTEFAMFGEGNVYNKLFYKVLSYPLPFMNIGNKTKSLVGPQTLFK